MNLNATALDPANPWPVAEVTRVALFFWRRIMLTLLAASLFCGCSWRTQSTAYCLGPFFMRIGGVESNLCQTVHVPVLLQAGRQCGLSVGWENQISTLEKTAGSNVVSDHCWRLRFWQVLPLAARPEFSRNKFFGARFQAGTADTGATVGYTADVEIRPQQEGIYWLAFDSNQPMAAKFKFWRGVPADFTDILATTKNNPKK